MSRFVDIETLQAEGHTVLDAQELYAQLGLDQFGQAFENTVKPDGFQNFGFDQSAAALAQTDYIAGRQTHASGIEYGGDTDDPDSTNAARRRNFQVYSQTALVSQQISTTLSDLWTSVERITSDINSLQAEGDAIIDRRQEIQTDVADARSTIAEAEEDLNAQNEIIDEASAALEAAIEARQAADDALCSTPPGGMPGLEELLDPDSEANQHYHDQARLSEEARLQQMRAFGDIDRASMRIYEGQQAIEGAETEIAELSQEDRMLAERYEAIGVEITSLTQELELTQAQIARLENPETIAAIERGDLTVEDAVASVSRNVEFNGSSLTKEAAADADGQGVNVDTGVTLNASFNRATGLTPEEMTPETAALSAERELTQAELVMRQAQEAAARMALTRT